MAVIENYRGKGIGTKLLEKIIEEYKKINVEKISLSVDKLNKAKKLYERFGFKTVNKSKDGNPTMLLNIIKDSTQHLSLRWVRSTNNEG